MTDIREQPDDPDDALPHRVVDISKFNCLRDSDGKSTLIAFVTDGLDLADYDNGFDDLQLGYSLDEAAYEQLYSCVCDYEQNKELVLDLLEKRSRCDAIVYVHDVGWRLFRLVRLNDPEERPEMRRKPGVPKRGALWCMSGHGPAVKAGLSHD